MPPVNVPIFKGDTSDFTPDWRDALPVNMFFVPRPLLGSVGYLRSSYGLTSFGTGLGTDRGGIYSERDSTHYRVSGDRFISVQPSGGVGNLGAISETGQCTLNETFQNVAVTTSGSLFLYNTVDGLRQVLDPDLGTVFDSTYINQRLIHTDGESLIVSDPGQDDVYNPLNFGSAETLPDGIVGVGRLYNKLLAFGRNGIEWFFDAQLEFFPFQRIDAQYIAVGLVGTHAKTLYVDNDGNPTYAFIGSGENEPVAIRLIGQANAPKISTREIDEILLTYSSFELSSAILERRKFEHNDFLICHLPNHTLQYDRAASNATGEPMWTIQKSNTTGVLSSQTPTRWINGIFDPDLNNWVYGDKSNSNIGQLDKNETTEYGEIKEERFFTPLLPFDKKSVHELFMEDLPGRADVGTDPQIFLSATQDAVNYSQEVLLNLGKTGQYGRNFYVRQLGYFDNYAGFQFRKANKLPIAIGNLRLEVS